MPGANSGPTHPTTIVSAAHLSFVLGARGDSEHALTLGTDNYQRAARNLGDDNLVTLLSAAAECSALANAGLTEQARMLGENNHRRAELEFGPDHLVTLLTAHIVTHALAASGRTEDAHVLGDDTLRRTRRALGFDHPLAQSLQRLLNLRPPGSRVTSGAGQSTPNGSTNPQSPVSTPNPARGRQGMLHRRYRICRRTAWR